MKKFDVEKCKKDLTAYFRGFNVHDLGVIARKIGVGRNTGRGVKGLISDMVAVETGERERRWTKVGKPPKNNYVSPEVLEMIEKIKEECYVEDTSSPKTVAELFPDLLVNGEVPSQKLSFSSTVGEKMNTNVYRAQFSLINGVARLLPTDCGEEDKPILLPETFIQTYDLREGDVLSFYVTEGKTSYIVKQILTINGLTERSAPRKHFDKCNVEIPFESIRFLNTNVQSSPLLKYLDWVVDVKKGQRCCVIAPPKIGKTTALYTMFEALKNSKENVVCMALLVEQPLETVSLFRSSGYNDNFVYTTYDDDVDKQVFSADFLLNRAKRRAESGLDVVLFVDSFNALAHAYNQTEESVGGKVLEGGLESKTVRYLKKFFGTARKLSEGGSLTIIGTVSENTGDIMDDVLTREIASIANVELRLDEKTAQKRVFPAIDGNATRVTAMQGFAQELDSFLKSDFLPVCGNMELPSILEEANTAEELYALACQKLKK